MLAELCFVEAIARPRCGMWETQSSCVALNPSHRVLMRFHVCIMQLKCCVSTPLTSIAVSYLLQLALVPGAQDIGCFAPNVSLNGGLRISELFVTGRDRN
jgi:hypothetical protein